MRRPKAAAALQKHRFWFPTSETVSRTSSACAQLVVFTLCLYSQADDAAGMRRTQRPMLAQRFMLFSLARSHFTAAPAPNLLPSVYYARHDTWPAVTLLLCERPRIGPEHHRGLPG